MKNEGDVKKEVKKILKSVDTCWYYMPVQTGYGAQGIPDFVVCVNGRFLGIETKFGSNGLSAWQEKQADGIEVAKGLYLVIYERNVSSLKPTLEAISALELQ